jgi:HK97 family phage prohead protease
MMAKREDYTVGDRIEFDMGFKVDAVDADLPDGFIKGIASTALTDSYGHKVMGGAFDDSIREKGLNGPTGVKLLAFHDWSKPAGVIKQLQTVNGQLRIEAQLSLKAGYVRDLYEVTKDIGGLNFSVGFRLLEFDFVEDEDMEKHDDAWILIKKGDLMEVSVVPFPANADAQMTYVKTAGTTPVAELNTFAEFERAIMADGLCKSRNEAHRLALWAKSNVHLLQPKLPLLVDKVTQPAHPLLDVSRLQPVAELIAKAKATLSGSQ